MTERFQWGVISDDKTETDQELIELDARIEKEQKEKQKELEKQKAKQEENLNPNRTLEIYREANFICVPSHTTIIRKGGEGAIQRHQETCDFCIEAREEKQKVLNFQHEGRSRMRYIIHVMVDAEQDIERLKKNRVIEVKKEKMIAAKKRREKVQELLDGLLPLEELEGVGGGNATGADDSLFFSLLERHDKVIRTYQHDVMELEHDLRRAEATVEKEEREKERLLNHENEIVRASAKEIHDQYLKMNEAERRQRFL